MKFKYGLIALSLLLFNSPTYACTYQEISYYAYMEKDELFSLYRACKEIYATNMRLRNTARANCKHDCYSKARMVLKKDHGLTDDELNIVTGK